MKKNEMSSKKKVSKVIVTFAMVIGCGIGMMSMTGCGIPGVSAAETDNVSDPYAMQEMQTTQATEPTSQDTPDTIVNEAPRTTVYEAPRRTYNDNSKTTIKEGSKTTVHESNSTTVNEAPRTSVNVAPETTVNQSQETQTVNVSNNEIGGSEEAQTEEVSEDEAVCEQNVMSNDEVISALIGVWVPETIESDSFGYHFGHMGAGGLSTSGGVFGANRLLVIPDEAGSCGGASALATSLEGATLNCSPIQDSNAAGSGIPELQIDISQIDEDMITINGVPYERYSTDPDDRDYQE